MKKIVILIGAVALVFSSCCGGSKTPKSEKDSLAYVVGLNCGNYIKNVDSTLDLNVVMAAIKDVMKDKPKMTQEAAYGFMNEYFSVRLPKKNAEASEEFLAGIEKQKGVQKTESGLLYEIITPGSDVKAASDEDVVRVMYSGTLPNGKVFDSSYERGDTAEFALNRVIRGWGEGLKLIGEGGKIKLWIPSDLAYGPQGAGQVIGPNQAIVFEVELFGVTPVVPEPEEAPAK